MGRLCVLWVWRLFVSRLRVLHPTPMRRAFFIAPGARRSPGPGSGLFIFIAVEGRAMQRASSLTHASSLRGLYAATQVAKDNLLNANANAKSLSMRDQQLQKTQQTVDTLHQTLAQHMEEKSKLDLHNNAHYALLLIMTKAFMGIPLSEEDKTTYNAQYHYFDHIIEKSLGKKAPTLNDLNWASLIHLGDQPVFTEQEMGWLNRYGIGDTLRKQGHQRAQSLRTAGLS